MTPCFLQSPREGVVDAREAKCEQLVPQLSFFMFNSFDMHVHPFQCVHQFKSLDAFEEEHYVC
jgi:hypothetical protein